MRYFEVTAGAGEPGEAVSLPTGATNLLLRNHSAADLTLYFNGSEDSPSGEVLVDEELEFCGLVPKKLSSIAVKGTAGTEILRVWTW